MADDVRRIRNLLRRLVWRERLLLLARVLGRAALVWAASLAWFALGPHVGVERAAAVLVLVVGAGVGGWLAAAWPLLREWRATGDDLRQAGRVESVRPALRGRLVTAVDSAGRPAQPDGDALMGLVVSRAARGVADVRVGEVHGLRRAVPALALGSAAVVVGLLALLVAGPRRAVSWWFRGSEALAAAVFEDLQGPTETARVGDLVLEYTFPDYTGMPPKVVENGTGEVEAPPGTRVAIRARAADAAEAAGLVAYDENLEAVLDADGRGVAGGFEVKAEPGTWHFTVYRGGEAEASRDFAITPVQDLPPAVTLSVDEGKEVLQVAVDQRFSFDWQARDDYGVRSVFLEVDGKDREPPLDRPERRKAEVGGRGGTSPRDLGLKAGDRVKIAVAAWDNDTVSGAKRGVSRSIEIVVLGANGREDQIAARREELVEVLIPILADHLVDPWPPADDGGGLASWGEAVAGRYRPLGELAEDLWSGMKKAGADRRAIERVVETGRDLVRYTQTAVEPGSTGPVPAETFQMAGKLRSDAIAAVEDAVLLLNRMTELRALGEVAQSAEELSSAAARLEQTLASENPDVQELLAQLDQLERMMGRLAQQASKLGSQGLQEYIQSRQSEIANLMDEIRKAIAEGRLDDARKMMQRLADNLREMQAGIEGQMNSAQSESEDGQDAAAELQKELEELEREQRALQSEVDRLEQDDQSDATADKLWNELARRAAEHAASTGAFSAGLDAAGRSFMERERAASGADAASSVSRAIEARDIRGARDSVAQGLYAWKIERRLLEGELRRRPGQIPGPGLPDVHELVGQLDAMQKLLDQLESAETQMDPATRAKAQELEQRQRELEQRTQEAAEKGRQLEQNFPVRPQGMGEAMKDAQQRMEQAGDDLRDGQPMQAGGSQRMAADRLKEAREALQEAQDQAAQQMREMQQGQGQGGGKGDEEEGEQPGEDEGDGHEFDRDSDLDIPGREAFQTPEEYRRALLEGMEGEVPEEYRAMKKRYFEELVSQ